jgi:hypothetical protein
VAAFVTGPGDFAAGAADGAATGDEIGAGVGEATGDRLGAGVGAVPCARTVIIATTVRVKGSLSRFSRPLGSFDGGFAPDRLKPDG